MRILLWGNAVIGASAAGWVALSCASFGAAPDPVLCLLAFAMTAGYYTYDRLVPGELTADTCAMPERTAWMVRNAHNLRLAIAVEALVALGCLTLRPQVIPVLAAVAVAALGYTARLVPFRGGRAGLKHLPGTKVPFVAVLWTLVVVVAPALVHARSGSPVVAVACATTLLVGTQVLVNDLRDAESDARANTMSLPVLFGDRGAKLVGTSMLAAAAGCAVFADSPSLAAVALGTAVALHGYSRPKDARWRPWIEAQGMVAALFFVVL